MAARVCGCDVVSIAGNIGQSAIDVVVSVASAIAKVASKSIDWMKESGGVKNLVLKPLDLCQQWCHFFGVKLSQPYHQLTVVSGTFKGFIGATEAFTKLGNLTKPLLVRSIHHAQADDQAPEAGLLEILGKKASQVSDWIMSVADCHEFLRKMGLTNFPKEVLKGIRWVSNSAGGILSLHGLYEEITKIVYGHIVATVDIRNPRTGAVITPAGTTVAMQAEDYVLSAIKIAMCISYLVVSTLGILALSGVIVPHAMFIQLAALTMACATTIGSYFVKHLTVRPELLNLV